MKSIDALLPGAGEDDLEGLRALDADDLAHYVIDTGNPWWRRRRCVTALAGRVPRSRVPRLLERIRDTCDTTEVRVALLELLADQAELLPWLRHPDRDTESRHRMPEAIAKARGVAGDLTAIPRLTSHANDDWPHIRATGEAGLGALVTRHGVEAVLARIGTDRPQDRACAAWLRHRADGDITDALADPDATVAYRAATLLDDAERLRGYLSEAPGLDAKLWAAWALHRLTGDAAETRQIHRSLGRPRVEVDGLDEEVRAAIVAEWVPRCQRRTDPRWRLEAVCAEYAAPDTDEQLRRAATALTRAGLAPKDPHWAGDDSPGGYGTYHTIKHDAGYVWLSTMGRFITNDEPDPAERGVLEAAGFRWLDDELAAVTVTGLHTYYFGDRGTRSVNQLLFHWTD